MRRGVENGSLLEGVSVLSVLSWKKVLVVALFGAVLFMVSFLASDKIGAYGFWGYQYGDPQYGVQYDQYGGGQTMVASYYGYELAGSPTASGEPFNPEGYTAAHKTLPLGTQLQVSYGGSTVNVTVNDRGPYVAGRDLDLSQGAAEAIGLTGVGSDAVQVTVLN